MSCKAGVTAQNLVLMGEPFFGLLLYDVADPLHPRLLCRISSTSARIADGDSIAYLEPVSSTETDVMVRSLQTGLDRKAASFPTSFDVRAAFSASGSWWPDGSRVAYTGNAGSGGAAQVWVYANGMLKTVNSYPWPLTDCICRFGLPSQTNAFSPDGQYLVSGWPIGKGAAPFVVSLVADGNRIQAFDLNVLEVLWARTGHQLFLIGQNGVRSWTPEAGMTAMPGTSQWTYFPSLSPDGGQAVYTAYIDQNQTQPRAFSYDFAAKSTKQLSPLARTQVMFVKTGWVWYLDESTCQPSDNQCPPWQSNPTGKVFAQNLATGQESVVSFGAGEAPTVTTNWTVFVGQELWPA